ncbi:MAG: magnesium/cobalt transporter CorA, partial [Candidatus Omnitrophica bacterium]|nr:magnesium/cobalt transporter CorA [Candidatus Omnitrophota bacterium]
LNTDQRPKMEDFGSYIYMVMKMLSYNQAEAEVEIEQVSMILGNNFLISFQEKEGDVFDSIRERIRTAKGRIRKSGVDYLVYTLIDAVIDNYFLILEKIGEKIEVLEEELINTPTQETMRNIHSLKREMIFLRKSVWPMRELINGLQKSESSVINKSTGIFLRDVYDHTIQVIDTVESLRDMASGMLDIYLSSISNRMNEVMKVLTIFAAIFIPLTFIAGVYGMNFKFMPELEWKYGYFVALSLMAAVGITLVLFFKRKKWF